MGLAQVSTLDSPTGAALNLYRAVPKDAKAILLVFHGLAEHAGRYERFLGDMAATGFAVYAHDHRGHGSTSAQDAPFRRFARTDGADRVLRDCRAVLDEARSSQPGLPVFVFGHSMGGLIALNFAEENGADLRGAAIWNADARSNWQVRIGGIGLKIEKALKGSDVASLLFRRAMFDAWARSIPDRRTDFDWLSHDRKAVDAYVADPLCGFTPTVSMMEDVLQFVRQGANPKLIRRLPKGLPFLLVGGAEDPATGNGAAMLWLAERLRRHGSADVSVEIVENARHETLNETPAVQRIAVAGLTRWLLARLD